MVVIPVAKPEWLEGGVESFERLIKLWRAGNVPDALLGWMFVVDCMRILRAVYGDDLSTAAAIRERVLADEARHLEMETESERIEKEVARG